MKIPIIKSIAVVLLLISNYYTYANNQTISVDDSLLSTAITIEDYVVLDVYHQTDYGSKPTGLLLNCFYDNSILELESVENILDKNRVNTTLSASKHTDTKNLDNNSNTNQYFSFLWVDYGYRNWLDHHQTLLYQLTFRVKKDFSKTDIGFTGEASTGYELAVPVIELQGAN